MKLIATHDSSTGEKGQGILSYLVTPFSKTQSKTLKQQYEAGCRLFDIRIKLYNDTWYCAHGLWKSKLTAFEIFNILNSFKENVAVTITYEGKQKHNDDFLKYIQYIKWRFPNIFYGGIAVKYGEVKGVKVKYTYLLPPDDDYKVFVKATKQGFLPLDGRSWHTYIPIPWLWNKIYTSNHEFNNTEYIYVDFL